MRSAPRPEYERQLVQDLRWFGLDWDEGPDVQAGHSGPTASRSAPSIYMGSTWRNCWPPATLITLSVPPSNWRPSARKR